MSYTPITIPRLYNIPVSEKQPNGTEIMRNLKSLKGISFEPAPGIDNLQKMIMYARSIYGKLDFVGTKNPKTGTYSFETYEDICKKARYFASSLFNLNLLATVQEYPGKQTMKMVGIYAKNRPEWTICDMGNALYGYTMIPLYDTLGPDSVSFVFEHSEIITCICSKESIDILSNTPKLHKLRNIIALDGDYNKASADKLQKRGITIYSFYDLLIKGKANKQPLPQTIDTDQVFTFSYTSGTTGNPKGAMITHRNILAAVTSHISTDFKFLSTDTHLSFLPLPHIFERFVNGTCWFTGCKIAFYGGDMLKLKDDISAAKPTVMILVPRIINKFYEEINSFFNSAPQNIRDLFHKAVAEKLGRIKKITDEQAQGINLTLDPNSLKPFEHEVYDKMIFAKVKEMFGGRLRIVVCGSAPVSQKALDFMKVVVCCPFIQGFGQTEGSGIGTVSYIDDYGESHVGGNLVSADFKLEDVPEMGYMSTDKNEKGQNQPRGEICMRGHLIFAGYFRDQEKTNETIDSEGWMHSGDIGLLLPNGALKIIDRKKNIFKLAQGEYISPEKIENTYIRARGVQEVFVHGDSLERYCVGIIVPKPEEIAKIAQEIGVTETDLEKLCQNPKVTQFYLKKILAQGKNEGLHSFEQAQKITLEPKSLALHGCLTNSFKLQRHLARKVFDKQIKQMYSTPFISETPKL